MYTYPQALDAMQKIANDLFKAAGSSYKAAVIADPVTGTASVQWEQSGREAVIRMPVLPAHHRMTQPEFDDYAGFIFHEVGHPLFTDKNVWERSIVLGQSRLLNALEDVRIEKALISAKIAANGKAALEGLVRSLDYKATGDKFDANDPRNIGFILGFLGRSQNGYDIEASRLTKKIRAGSPVAKVLEWALPELAKCTSTQDCLDLALKVIKALPKKDPKQDKPKGEQKTNPGKQPKQDQPKGPAGGQGEGEPQDGEGEQGEGEQAGEGEGDKGDKGKGAQKGEGAEGDKPEGEALKGGQGAGEQPEEGLSDKDVREVNLRPESDKELSNKGGFKNPALVEAGVIAAIREANKQGSLTPPKASSCRNTYEVNEVARKAAQCSRQRALLARALRKNEQDNYEGGLKHGRLDRRAYSRVAAGSTNVFGRRDLTEGYETDVVILVDGSGSMILGNIQAAAPMSLVIAQAAAQVGVSCSTYVFGTTVNGYTMRNFHGLVEVNAGRTKPSADKFAEMIELAGGGTPLSASMLAVAQRQIDRAPVKRRILFVVSDGMCSQGAMVLKSTATFIEKAMGTETVNLSIGEPLQGCFENEVYVNPNADIASVGLETVVRKLMKGAQ
jgi:Mg-chelatase subunit ChlD